MGYCLFISDLHLCESRPEIIDAFSSFLETTASKADALYILGDLFEYWAGDDAIDVGVHHQTIQALNKLHQQGVTTYFIHGNRDFLIGNYFSQASCVKILTDPSLINLYGKSILITHGDILCTDDVDYQVFRNEVRTVDWQETFLSQPLANRIGYIQSMREKSEREKSVKSMKIMDVNLATVAALLKDKDYPPFLIHGHTHRPKLHQHSFDGHQCERWVLGDWFDHGSYLKIDSKGFHECAL